MYTNVFGGSTVQPADVSYRSFVIVADLRLTWPSAFIDSQTVAAHIVDINPTVGGLSLFLPDATQVSPGQDILINNIGANAITVRDFLGNILLVQNAATSWYLYLTNNTTPQGVWRTVPFAGGVAAVTSVNAVSLSPEITVVGGPIINNGTFTFNVGPNITAISGIGNGGPNGYLVRTAANAWASRTFQAGANMALTNPAGTAGNTTIALQPNIIINQANIGNIQINANTIMVTDLNGDLNLLANGTGAIKANSEVEILAGNFLKFFNFPNTFFTALQAPNVPTNTIFTLMAADGSNGQAIVTNGAGALSFASFSGFPSGPGSSTVDAIARFADVNGNIKNSNARINDAGDITLNDFAAINNLSAISGHAADPIICFNDFKILSGEHLIFESTGGNTFSFSAPNPLVNQAYTLPAAAPVSFGDVFSFNGAGTTRWRPVQELSAWGTFDNTGALLNSFNANVVQDAAGLFTVTFIAPSATPFYSIVLSVNGQDDATNTFFFANYFTQTVNGFRIKVRNNAGALGNPVNTSFQVII